MSPDERKVLAILTATAVAGLAIGTLAGPAVLGAVVGAVVLVLVH